MGRSLALAIALCGLALMAAGGAVIAGAPVGAALAVAGALIVAYGLVGIDVDHR